MTEFPFELRVDRGRPRGGELVQAVLDAQGLGRVRAVRDLKVLDTTPDGDDELVDALVLGGHVLRTAASASLGDVLGAEVALHLHLVGEGGQLARQDGDHVDLLVLAGGGDRGGHPQAAEDTRAARVGMTTRTSSFERTRQLRREKREPVLRLPAFAPPGACGPMGRLSGRAFAC